MSQSFSLQKYKTKEKLKTKGSVYKSYCAESEYPSVIKIKCDDDCNEGEIAFIEFAAFGVIKGSCPEYMPDYCGQDSHVKLNELCQEKTECKTKVSQDVFGKLQYGCKKQDLKLLFTCACNAFPPAKTKQKEIASDGKKTFIEQMKKVFNDDESMYMMLDKDASLQVFDTEGNSKYSTGAMKSKGEEPFTLELTTKGDLQIQDDSDKVLWNTETEDKGKAPYKVTLSDKGKILLKDSTDEEIWKSK